MSKWISINDRLPESNKKILITNGIDIMIGSYCNLCNIFESDYIDVGAASHWMLLPSIPEFDK